MKKCTYRMSFRKQWVVFILSPITLCLISLSPLFLFRVLDIFAHLFVMVIMIERLNLIYSSIRHDF